MVDKSKQMAKPKTECRRSFSLARSNISNCLKFRIQEKYMLHLVWAAKCPVFNVNHDPEAHLADNVA